MSPGVTFERVYRELKRRLADGSLRPGQPIEPAAMSAELAASITPIRDALHRLVGERLVEAPNHNGFRAPRLSEAELRDLYLWNGRLLGLSIRHRRPEALHEIDPLPSAEPSATIAVLSQRIAGATGSNEHARAVDQLNDRLAPYRRVEPSVLDGLAEEIVVISTMVHTAEPARIIPALTRYHRRRAVAAPDILTASIAGV